MSSCAEYFEYQSPDYNPSNNIAVTASDFEYFNDFGKVVVSGNTYHFGNIQAKVIKQLYAAAKTRSPWLCGKELLYNAGSRTMRMRDLFKDHVSWQNFIESDQRGNYRLNYKYKILDKT